MNDPYPLPYRTAAPQPRRRALLPPIAAISQLVVALLMTGLGGVLQLQLAAAPAAPPARGGGQGEVRGPGPAGRRLAKTVGVVLLAAATAQLVLVAGVWRGSRPATVASAAVAGVLVVWEVLRLAAEFAFAGKRGPSVLLVGLAVFGVVVYAALAVVLVEILKRRPPSPHAAPAADPAAGVAGPPASGPPQRGLAGWTQVAAGVLLLLVAGFAAFSTHMAVGAPKRAGRAEVGGVAMTSDQLRLARTASLLIAAAAVAQLAMAPAVGAGSRPATLASMALAGVLAAVHGLAFAGAAARGAAPAAVTAALFLAVEFLLLMLLLAAARVAGGARGSPDAARTH